MTKLKAFLHCTDLDDLLKAYGRLRKIRKRQQKCILEVLSAWDQPQSIANILFYPEIIPKDERFQCISKALTEKKQPYYKLAAIVGISNFEREAFSSDQRDTIIDLLFSILEHDKGLIADRTVLALWNLIDEHHIPKALRLLEHANENVRHNILAWLIRQYADGNPNGLANEISNSSIAQTIKEYCLAAIDEHNKKKETGQFSNTDMALLSYIPNFSEMIS
jgi:hypothetical protein